MNNNQSSADQLSSSTAALLSAVELSNSLDTSHHLQRSKKPKTERSAQKTPSATKPKIFAATTTVSSASSTLSATTASTSKKDTTAATTSDWRQSEIVNTDAVAVDSSPATAASTSTSAMDAALIISSLAPEPGPPPKVKPKSHKKKVQQTQFHRKKPEALVPLRLTASIPPPIASLKSSTFSSIGLTSSIGAQRKRRRADDTNDDADGDDDEINVNDDNDDADDDKDVGKASVGKSKASKVRTSESCVERWFRSC
jgi:hypothetical protein